MDDKIRKIYARHKSDKLSPSAKNNSRCLNIMAKQNKILGKCNGKLSKEQAKKLKSRFNEIVNEMYKSERKRKDSLPRIIEQWCDCSFLSS